MQLIDALGLRPETIIAYVGAGGKSTAIWRVSQEMAARSARVLIAPTSHILEPILPPDTALYLAAQPEPNRITALLDRSARLIVAATRDQSVDFDPAADFPPARSTKLRGLPPETIDQLAPQVPRATWLIEADGSRRHPLKAPGAHEPPIPACVTDVVIVASLDAIGQPLDEDSVHRSEIFASIANARLGKPITAEMITRVLQHTDGGLKNIPSRSRVHVLLTQRDQRRRHASANRLIDVLTQSNRFDHIVVASLRADNPILQRESPMTLPSSPVTRHIAGVILAAGGSTRFGGQPKQLLEWHGRTLIETAVDTARAAGLDPIVVVIGAYADQVRAKLIDRKVIVVENADWSSGQSTSVKAGLNALPGEVEAAVFILVDQPNLTPEILRELINAHVTAHQPIVVASVNGKRTTPTLFHRSLFDAIRTIEGDRGAREIIDADPSRVAKVEVDPISAVDIDTREDYNRLRGARGEG